MGNSIIKSYFRFKRDYCQVVILTNEKNPIILKTKYNFIDLDKIKQKINVYNEYYMAHIIKVNGIYRYQYLRKDKLAKIVNNNVIELDYLRYKDHKLYFFVKEQLVDDPYKYFANMVCKANKIF
jgi:hypothetical protein